MPQAPTPLHQKKAWQACVLRIQAGAELQAAEAGTKVPTAAAVSRKIFSAMPPPALKSKEQDPEGKHDPETAFERSWKLYLTGERVPSPARQLEIFQAATALWPEGMYGFSRYIPPMPDLNPDDGIKVAKYMRDLKSIGDCLIDVAEKKYATLTMEAETRADVLLDALNALARPVAVADQMSKSAASTLVSIEKRAAIKSAVADLLATWKSGATR